MVAWMAIEMVWSSPGKSLANLRVAMPDGSCPGGGAGPVVKAVVRWLWIVIVLTTIQTETMHGRVSVEVQLIIGIVVLILFVSNIASGVMTLNGGRSLSDILAGVIVLPGPNA